MTSKEYQQLHYNFRVKRPLPIYDLPRPPIATENKDNACVIWTLWEAYTGIVPTYTINSAFWAMHAWLVNTNILERGWDIKFLVERNLYAHESVRSQFEKANITDLVVLFDILPFTDTVTRRLGNKVQALLEPTFDKYERAYLWDTDNFISIRDRNNRLDVTRLLDIGEDNDILKVYDYSTMPSTQMHWDVYGDDSETSKERMYGHLTDYLGYRPEKIYGGVTGCLQAWNPIEIGEASKDMVRTLIPKIACDEVAYSCLLQKTGRLPTKLKDCWDIPLCNHRPDYFRDEPHYFDHIWLDRNEQDWEIWHAQTSKQQVDPISAYNDPDIAEIWRQNIGLNERL